LHGQWWQTGDNFANTIPKSESCWDGNTTYSCEADHRTDKHTVGCSCLWNNWPWLWPPV
jgi:hypothetical protein